MEGFAHSTVLLEWILTSTVLSVKNLEVNYLI